MNMIMICIVYNTNIYLYIFSNFKNNCCELQGHARKQALVFSDVRTAQVKRSRRRLLVVEFLIVVCVLCVV